MRVLLCGDPFWSNARSVKERLARLPTGTTIVCGTTRGADRLARKSAAALGLVIEAFPPSAPGPARNRQMLDTLPTLVLAFHANIDRARSTRDCVEEARRRGIEVDVIER